MKQSKPQTDIGLKVGDRVRLIATAAFSDPQEELSSYRGHLRNEASEGLVRLLGSAMAGFATRPSFAGHAGSSATTNHELTSILDHLMGAGQSARTPGRFSSL
jgi:hypothetical protein